MTNTKSRRSAEIRFPLDPELVVALDGACNEDRVSRTGYLRGALLKSLREAGFLDRPGKALEAGR